MQRGLQFTALVGDRPRLLVGTVGRHEVDELGEVVGPEEQHRIDVAFSDAHAEMEDRAGVVGVGAARRADDVTAGDGLAFPHRDRLQKRVRRAEISAVHDRDVQGAGDGAREAHDTVVGRPDRRAGRGGEVDAPMPGAVDR